MKKGKTTFLFLILMVVGFAGCVTAEKHRAKGWDYYQSSKYYIALQEYNRAIEIDPTVADIFFQRGHVHRAMKNNDLALNDYRKALEINPNGSNILAYIGEIYFGRGDFETALDYYNRSISIRANNQLATNGIKKIENLRAEAEKVEASRLAEEQRRQAAQLEQNRLQQLFNSSPASFGSLRNTSRSYAVDVPFVGYTITTYNFGDGNYILEIRGASFRATITTTGTYRVNGDTVIFFSSKGEYSYGTIVGTALRIGNNVYR